MREGRSLQSRRELLQHMLPQYREASTVKKKSKLLDAFRAATGYHRKYAMWLLNHAKEGQPTPHRPGSRREAARGPTCLVPGLARRQRSLCYGYVAEAADCDPYVPGVEGSQPGLTSSQTGAPIAA